MKYIRCRRCREWFVAASACPECGTKRPGFNKHLRTSMLDNHLFAQAESANREKQLESQMRG